MIRNPFKRQPKKNPRLDEFGREVLDKTPLSIPVGFVKPESLEVKMARAIRLASLQAQQQGYETIEESEDFDLEDDEMRSEYELVHDSALGREITQHEKLELDKQRAIFDDYIRKNPPKSKAKTRKSPPEDAKGDQVSPEPDLENDPR